MKINEMMEELLKLEKELGGESEVLIEHSNGVQVSSIEKVSKSNGRVFVVESK